MGESPGLNHVTRENGRGEDASGREIPKTTHEIGNLFLKKKRRWKKRKWLRWRMSRRAAHLPFSHFPFFLSVF
jgi:hypothetical protein